MPRFVPVSIYKPAILQAHDTPLPGYRGGRKLTFITCWGMVVKPFSEAGLTSTGFRLWVLPFAGLTKTHGESSC